MDEKESALLTESVEEALKVLRDGGIILYPTDTVWGLGCDATHSGAIERIYQLKRRPDAKSMIILVADRRDILTYAAQPHPDAFPMLEKASRPTTVIFDHALGLPANLTGADGSIAMRLTRETFSRTLVKRLRAPLVSTSANLSGAPTARFFDEISPEIRNGVDYVVPYRQDDRTPRAPSRIIRMAADGGVTVIRD